MIVGLSLLIVFVLVSYFFSNKNYDHVKVDSSQNFVFKRNSDYSGTDKNVPYINVEGTAASEYNAEIMRFADDFLSFEKNKMGFVFNKSDSILSLSIKLVDYNNEYQRPVTSFKNYILDLKTQKPYSKEQIYKDYAVDDVMVQKSIEKRFKKMYQDVVKQGYIDDNYCDYDCFLRWRGVSNYLEGAEPYIENKKLIFFKGFDTESIFGEEDYFESEDFKFEVLG